MSSPPLFILLCSAEREKFQMAAMCASVAAVSERRVLVFVSMNALGVFKRSAKPCEYPGGEFADLLRTKNAPDPLDLFSAGKELGDLNILACSMALDVAGLELDDLQSALIDRVGGLTQFLSDAEAGQLMVF